MENNPNGYRITIEKLDFDHNVLYKCVDMIAGRTIEEIKKSHNIDALEEVFKRLNKHFKQYEQNS